MKERIQISARAFVFCLMALAFISTRAEHALAQDSATPAAVADAVAALPESDAIVLVDVRRTLTEAPRVLSAIAPDLLSRYNNKLREFQERTKIDPSVFDGVAIGVRYPSNGTQASGVAIIKVNSGAQAIITAGLAAAQAEGRPLPQQRTDAQGRTLYVYNTNRDDVAFAALNDTTIVVGNLAGTQAALDGGTRVSSDLVQLAQRTPNALVGFSGNVPASFASQIGSSGFGGQLVAQLFSSVQRFYGSTNVVGDNGEALVGLVTGAPDQASSLATQLNTLKQFASLGLGFGGSSASVLSIINNLNISAKDNAVEISLRQPLSELTKLLQRSQSLKKDNAGSPRFVRPRA